LCREAQTKIRALGTRNKSTADTWNSLLGFGGALTNPDGGLAAPAGEVRDLKKKRSVEPEKRAFIPCSTTVWLENCNGWPDAAPVVKREAEAEPEKRAPVAQPVKKDVEVKRAPVAQPVKRDVEVKRGVPFIPCSASVWIDDCTGWP